MPTKAPKSDERPAQCREQNLFPIIQERTFTRWRYQDPSVTVDQVLHPMFFRSVNRTGIEMKIFDRVEFEVDGGYFEARVYDIDPVTSDPLLMRISNIHDRPIVAEKSSKAAA